VIDRLDIHRRHPETGLVFGLMIADYLGYVNEGTPRVRGYVDRAIARPAFQRAAGS